MKSKKKYSCETSTCKNKISIGRKCGSCRCSDFRKRDPERYAYGNLKNNAKSRGIVFELTIEEFRLFCVKTDYIVGKGRTKESFTIDRIENDKGYIYSNIRVLTNAENASKGSKKLEYDYYEGKFTVTTQPIIPKSDNNPF